MTERESQELIDKTQMLLEEGKFEEALQEADRVLQIAPDDIAVLRQKAYALLSLSQGEAALECYDRILRIAPDNAVLIAEKADFLSASDRVEEAIAAYDLALKFSPNNVLYLRQKALAFSRLDRHAEAIACYDQALSANPEDTETLIAKGDALINDSKFKEAIQCFERAGEINPQAFTAQAWSTRGDSISRAGHVGDALIFYDRALALDPNYAWAWRGKALALRRNTNTLNEALYHLDRALELAKDNAKDNALFLLDKGNVLFDLGNYREADGCYARAVELDSTSYYALLNRAVTLERLGEYKKAIVYADQALQLNSKEPDLWVEKGVCLGRLRQLDEALVCYEEALKIDPRCFWALNNKGWTLSELGRPEEGLVWLEKAIEVDSTETLPWTNKGDGLIKLGRLDEALATLKTALERVTDKRGVLESLGSLSSEYLFDHETAYGYYQKRLELDPADVNTRANIAECLVKTGRYSEGRAAALALAESQQDRALRGAMRIIIMSAYALEGDTASRTREFGEFLKCLSSADRIDPANPSWNFRGLIRILSKAQVPEETQFLLLAAIDMLSGKVQLPALTYFDSSRVQGASPTAA